MLRSPTLFTRPSIARIVEDGRLLCPVRMRDIDVERCVGCAFLAGVVPGEDGGPAEIVCAPSARSLRATW